MFNTKLTQSIAEAAKKVMDEELKGQQHKIDVNKNNKIDAEDFKHLRSGKKPVEEAMQKADVPAYLRKQQGEKPLTVADVKGPRKDSISASANLAKARNEEVEQIEEADIEKTATGMKVYGSSYGNSVRARREQVKKSIDTAKGPKMKDIAGIEAEKKTKKKFSEMVESYVESGIKGLFESIIKEEPTNDEYHAEVKKAQDKSEGKEKADVAKAAVQAVQSEGFELPGGTSHHEVYDKDGKLHSSHGAQRERAVKTAKEIGGKAYRVHGSGYDMKRTEIKEDAEQLDELSPGTLKSYVNKAKPVVQAAKAERADARDSGDGKTANDAYQLAKKRTAGIKQAKAKLNAEEVEQVEERTLSEPEMKKKEEVVKSMKKGLQGFKDRYGADAKSVMYATATKIAKKD